MKGSFYAILLLAAALAVTTFELVKLQHTSKQQPASVDKRAAVLENLHSRKSVRKFTSQAVSDSDLVMLVKAGMAAPSGHDARPWQFIIIKNKETMKKLRSKLEWARGLDGSTAAIVVCGDMSMVKPINKEFWITDASAATENILLAIEAMGLGGVWSTLYPGEDRMQHAREVLGLPAHVMPLCVIPIGYPTGVEKAKNKYNPAQLHWEKWESSKKES